MAKLLWNHLEQLRPRLARAPALLWGLDYDGTLAPIVSQPCEALPDPEARAVLHLLLRDPRNIVAIISGRPVKDLRELLALQAEYSPSASERGDRAEPALDRRLILAGVHGIEVSISGRTYALVDAESLRPTLLRIRKYWEEVCRQVPGALIEDKGWTVALHWRRVAPADTPAVATAIKDTLKTLDEQPGLELITGKMVAEVRPRSWHKGLAIRHLLAHEAPPGTLALYIGDDRTDEDVFRELNPPHITVRVEPFYSSTTAAEFFIDSQSQVARALNTLLELATP